MSRPQHNPDEVVYLQPQPRYVDIVIIDDDLVLVPMDTPRERDQTQLQPPVDDDGNTIINSPSSVTSASTIELLAPTNTPALTR